MKKGKLDWLERIVRIVCWITIAGTAFWTVMLPCICNLAVYMDRRYGTAPWSEALESPDFWKKLLMQLPPTVGVFLVLLLALRILAQVRKGRLFCQENVRCFHWAGAAGLLMAAFTVFQAYLRMEEMAGIWTCVRTMFDFPTGTAASLLLWTADFVHFGFCFVGGLFCLLMAQFLRRGMELQEEHDLTI